MGMDIPPVRAYEVGFRAGILAVNEREQKDVLYSSATIGDFNDPARGKSLAQGLIGQGCDIVLQLAGNSGLGVIEAVKEMEGVYAIGADMDQDDLAPGKVLTSILKRIDVAVFEAIRDALNGRLAAGHHLIGLKESATGLTAMVHTRDGVSGRAIKLVGKAEEWMRNGGANLPTSVKALEAWEIGSVVRGW